MTTYHETLNISFNGQIIGKYLLINVTFTNADLDWHLVLAKYVGKADKTVETSRTF